jgi:hypothetical protein
VWCVVCGVWCVVCGVWCCVCNVLYVCTVLYICWQLWQWTVSFPVGPEIQNHVLIIVSRVMLVIRSHIFSFWNLDFQKKITFDLERTTSMTCETITKTWFWISGPTGFVDFVCFPFLLFPPRLIPYSLRPKGGHFLEVSYHYFFFCDFQIQFKLLFQYTV